MTLAACSPLHLGLQVLERLLPQLQAHIARLR